MPKSSHLDKGILISTGELSGNLYGVEILKHIRTLLPGEKVYCLTPGELENLGATPLLTSSSHSVIGISEALENIKKIYLDFARIKNFLSTTYLKAVILIDFPEFNMRIARWAKQKGIKVIYFIPPQIWGWREWRIRSLKRFTDEVIVILPFEKTYYAERNLNVKFFGHPIIDIIYKEIGNNSPLFEDNQRSKNSPVVGILPGSRTSELKHHIPILNEAMKCISKRLPAATFMVPIAPSLKTKLNQIKKALKAPKGQINFVTENRYQAIKKCNLCIVASGTASLEVAILGIPMLVFYKVSTLTALVAKAMHRVQYVSLPNLIYGKGFIPELLQEKAHPEIISDFTYCILNSKEIQDTQRKCFDIIRKSLGKPGVMQKVAACIVENIIC